MNRRVAGAALLIVAAVLLLVVPEVAGGLAGTAEPVPVSPEPRVGDCLSSIDIFPSFGSAQLPSGSASADLNPFPAASVGSCSRAVVGEVASVDSGRPIRRGVTVAESPADCAEEARIYLGLPRTRTVSGISWTPSVMAGSQQIGPDARQRAAGQRWTGCVVTGAAATYSGPIRAAFTRGVLPAVFGLCWPGAVSLGAELITCSSPHSSQLLATGIVDGARSVTLVSLAASCLQYATPLMGRQPESGGQLAVRVSAEGLGSQVLLCSVSAVPGRQLVGSLLGIGSKPLPWSR